MTAERRSKTSKQKMAVRQVRDLPRTERAKPADLPSGADEN